MTPPWMVSFFNVAKNVIALQFQIMPQVFQIVKRLTIIFLIFILTITTISLFHCYIYVINDKRLTI